MESFTQVTGLVVLIGGRNIVWYAQLFCPYRTVDYGLLFWCSGKPGHDDRHATS